MRNLTQSETVIVILVAICTLFLLVKGFRRGEPWQFHVRPNSTGKLELAITQQKLGIREAVLRTDIPAAGNAGNMIVLIKRRSDLPIGTVLFADLTNLPGRIRFQLGKHVVDVMPRVIVIDGREMPWDHVMQTPVELGD